MMSKRIVLGIFVFLAFFITICSVSASTCSGGSCTFDWDSATADGWYKAHTLWDNGNWSYNVFRTHADTFGAVYGFNITNNITGYDTTTDRISKINATLENPQDNHYIIFGLNEVYSFGHLSNYNANLSVLVHSASNTIIWWWEDIGVGQTVVDQCNMAIDFSATPSWEFVLHANLSMYVQDVTGTIYCECNNFATGGSHQNLINYSRFIYPTLMDRDKDDTEFDNVTIVTTAAGAAPPASYTSTFNITANSSATNTAITTFNATLTNTSNITIFNTSVSPLIVYNRTELYNITINATNYFLGEYVDINVTNATLHTTLTPYWKVGVFNAWNDSQLVTYNITWNGSTYAPQADNYIYIPTNATANITINAPDYISRSLTDQNITANNSEANFTLWQTAINFTSYVKFTGDTIYNFSLVTLQGTFNTTNGSILIYPNADTYSWNWTNLEGYYNFTSLSYVVASGDTILNVSNAYDTVLNVTLTSAISGSLITNNTEIVVFETSNPTYTETFNTTTGYFEFNITSGTWNVSIDPDDYETQSNVSSINTSYYALNFTLWTTNSIGFNFRDEENGSLLDTGITTVELISDTAAYNYSTSNGTLYVDLITPETYNIRYSFPGYTTRTYWFTLVNRTHTNLTLYLLKNSSATSVTATVYDEFNNRLEDAYIKILRYDLATNSYLIREIARTNFAGETVFSAVLNDEYYYFIVEYPLGTVRQVTSPSKIFSSTITFYITTTASVLEEFYNSELRLSHDLSFNNVTNNFRFIYTDSSNLLDTACLQVWRVRTSGNTFVNETCVESSSGTILIGVANETGATFEAIAEVCYDGSCALVDSLLQYFRGERPLGKLGLFLIIIITCVFVFVAFYNLAIALPLIPLPLLLGSDSIMGLVPISTWLVVAIEVIAFILALIISRR